MYYYLFLIFFASLGILEAFKCSKGIKHNRGVKVSLDLFFYIILLFSVIVLTCMSSLRGEIGSDWVSYKRMFESCFSNRNFTDIEPTVERGYILVNLLFSKVTQNYFYMQFVLALFTSIVIFQNLFKNSLYPFFSLFIYYQSLYFLVHFEIVRQGLAIAILVLGIKFVKEKDLILWGGMVFLAMQFHVSALVAFPLYFTTFRRIPLVLAVLLVIFSIVVTLFGDSVVRMSLEGLVAISFLPDRIIHLINSYLAVENLYGEKVQFSTGLGFIVQYVINALIVGLCYINGNKSKEFCLFNFIIYLIINGVGRNLSVIGRCSQYYFICGYGILAYNLLIEKNKLYQKLDFIRLFILCIFISFFTLNFVKSFNEERISGRSNAEYYGKYETFLVR